MTAPAQRPGTLTFLITDIVGSTEQLERLGDEVGTSITLSIMTRLRDVATQHGGDLVKNMGDGLMMVFAGATDAVACAIAMQHAVTSGEWRYDPQEQRRVRIGVHAGEPILADGEYLGMVVNVAVRLAGSGSPGQILVSDVVRGIAGTRRDFRFVELGERVLSGLRTPIRLWEVVWTPPHDVAGPAVAPKPPQASPSDRAPDTVVILFVDIVDSIPHTERLGDAGFRERERELDALLRARIREHRGTPVEGKLVGDGVLAIFPSARSAIMCAMECGALSASVDLELHLGIHAGDVIRDGNNIYGGAVNLASRIAGVTNAGQILISDTVRGLARTSGGVSFIDCGDYRLKGVDEPMRLYTVRVRDVGAD